MFVNDNFVFLHLQKAAGTFVVDRLVQAMPGEVRDGHAPLTAGKGGRTVAAAIRDPWDWYVSLWSYGCMGRGEVQGRLTASRASILNRTLRVVAAGRMSPGAAMTSLWLDHDRDPAAWRDLYATAEDPERFRRWLRKVLTLPGCGHLPDAYPILPMREHVGFMTFRVLRLFTDWQAWKVESRSIRSPADALDFYRRCGIVDHVLRTEQVEADLERLFNMLSLPPPPIGTDTAPVHRNQSKRHQHTGYYDAETVALVLERDRMVVEAFGYVPPEIAA